MESKLTELFCLLVLTIGSVRTAVIEAACDKQLLRVQAANSQGLFGLVLRTNILPLRPSRLRTGRIQDIPCVLSE